MYIRASYNIIATDDMRYIIVPNMDLHVQEHTQMHTHIATHTFVATV